MFFFDLLTAVSHSDPHTTQRSGSIGDKSTDVEVEMDDTFHQKYAARINFIEMDPSLALVTYSSVWNLLHNLTALLRYDLLQCFLCKTKTEFTELCKRFHSDIVDAGIQPLFEITKTGHAPWLSQVSNEQNLATGYTRGGEIFKQKLSFCFYISWLWFRFRRTYHKWRIWRRIWIYYITWTMNIGCDPSRLLILRVLN